jgi:hypothetical protein
MPAVRQPRQDTGSTPGTRSASQTRFTENLTLAAVPSAAGAARRYVRSELTRAKLAILIDNAELVASELVTNAIIATGLIIPGSPSRPSHRRSRVRASTRSGAARRASGSFPAKRETRGGRSWPISGTSGWSISVAAPDCSGRSRAARPQRSQHGSRHRALRGEQESRSWRSTCAPCSRPQCAPACRTRRWWSTVSTTTRRARGHLTTRTSGPHAQPRDRPQTGQHGQAR